MQALITDQVHQLLIDKLQAAGVKTIYLPNINQKEVEAMIADFDILVINSKINVDADFLAKSKNLKVIGRLGSGLEIVDLDEAYRKGVRVFNSPEGNRDAVAEHAIGMLLALFNKLQDAHRDVIHFDWHREDNRGEELGGKTVGLIGFGNTGQALAKKLSGFDVDVLYYDKYKTSKSPYAQYADLEQIYSEVDVLSIHLPLTDDTRNFLNRDFINNMQKPFYLINTSRGKVLNQEYLLEGLLGEKVLGACIDVFENEQISSYSVKEKEQIAALQATRKVLFSTHVAGWTHQSKLKLADILAQKILTAFDE
jgi:D-3-phosphoglycerate dehydrogenase / 2-oxoglutarate reductase